MCFILLSSPEIDHQNYKFDSGHIINFKAVTTNFQKFQGTLKDVGGHVPQTYENMR